MRLFRYGILSVAVVASAQAWQNGPDGGTFRFETIELEQQTVAADGGEYTLLGLAGAGVNDEPGRPQVPVYRRLVEIPYGAEIEVGAAVEDVRTVFLDLPLYPCQYPVPKSGPQPEFVLDNTAYMTDKSHPEIGARIVEAAYMRGRRLALVEVYPVSYNPVENAVMVAGRIAVRVQWKNPDWTRTRSQRERYDSRAFLGRLRGVAENYGQLDFGPPPDLPVGFLVIVPDAWEPNVRPLAEWRRQKGYNVFVRNLTQVGGGQANTVKAYIQDAYDNWPIPPSFVLLVGDIDQVGYFTGQGVGSPPTDLNYALVEGSDYLPDIDVSRASVISAAQLDSLVGNILCYEQNGWSSGRDWLGRAYFIASSDGGNHQIAERTHAYVMAKLRPKGVQCDSVWLYYGQGTPITTALNTGRAWVTYSGHGDVNKWADPSPAYTTADVHNLTNVDMIPYVQTYACYSGNFASTSSPECFSEAWIRCGRSGGIAHIASSVTSYWKEDDTLERRVFDCMFDSSFHWLMGGFNRAKLIYYQQMGANSTTRRYLEMYNMMGDGAIDIYVHRPESIEVVHPLVVPLGSYPMLVSVRSSQGPVRNALVAVIARNDSMVFAAGYTDASGEVCLSVTTTAPDSLVITCTGHDLRPYLGSALALPAGGPYVLWQRYQVDDSAGGNNDGIINPGETINLRMWVRNWGGGTAQNVRTLLRVSDPNITLLDTLKSFGDIPAKDSAYTGPAGFGFRVAQSCTNGYQLRFTVSSRDANDSVWQSPMTLLVGAPRLEYAGHQAYDPPPGGNGNRTIDPGEEAELAVTLRNPGLGRALGVTAVLRSGDARFAVLDSLGSFGDILPGASGSNESDRFRVRADFSIPREAKVPCTLYARAGTQNWVCEFQIEVGIIRSTDPIPDGPRTPPCYYAYDVTDTLYDEAPVFSWVEIRGIGTRLSLSDDQTEVLNLPAGFGPWRYYGQSYSQISVCSNGWIAPGSTSYSGYSNTTLPNSSAPAMVCASWDDYDPRYGGGVWWYHDTLNRRFVVEYDSVNYVSSDAWDKFQLIVYDTTVATLSGDNEIVVQYASANSYNSTTVGLQDQTKSIVIQCLYNGTYHRGAAPVVPGMAVKYTTAPPTGIGEPGFQSPDLKLEFGRCAPNPFRSWTRISFGLAQPENTTLSVYDAGGRLVKKLVEQVLTPGRHFVTWNGLDGAGRRCSRGIYLVRLETGSGTGSAKLVLAE